MAWLASDLEWHSELVSLLAAEPDLSLFFRMIRENEVPARVVRGVLLERSDVNGETLATEAGGAREALIAALRDLPALTNLMDEELGGRGDGFLGRWRGR